MAASDLEIGEGGLFWRSAFCIESGTIYLRRFAAVADEWFVRVSHYDILTLRLVYCERASLNSFNCYLPDKFNFDYMLPKQLPDIHDFDCNVIAWTLKEGE